MVEVPKHTSHKEQSYTIYGEIALLRRHQSEEIRKLTKFSMAGVYSYGIVALELVAGTNNTRFRPSDGYFCLLDWALVLQKVGKLMELVDPRLLLDLDVEEAEKVIRIALLCASPSPALRTTMSEVVSMLQGYISIQEFNMDPSIYISELKLYELREKYEYVDSSETVALVHSNLIGEKGSPRNCL